jgi:transcriptional regulator with XRE-family HTH domain
MWCSLKQRIPNLLRRYRKARGLNQRQAARILGVSATSMISRWERGICLPSSLNIFKLAALYRTMADPLFPGLTSMLRKKLIKREEELNVSKQDKKATYERR